MTYPETARRFHTAEQSARYGAAPDPATLAADKLPMSAWAEARRADMTPQTIAANHALHVQGAALDLREADSAAPAFDPASAEGRFRAAARALLAAIGEGE